MKEEEKFGLHGVLVDVFGVGILILGKSGIGKSECALDLILRGHKLVVDDRVELEKTPPSAIFGYGKEPGNYCMEIRGLGIINVEDLFGITAVRQRKKLELVVELVEWTSEEDYERLGFEEKYYKILGVNIPFIIIPVSPGRNVATLIEVAARNHLLKTRGIYSALEYGRKQRLAIQAQRTEVEEVE